ncbi:hydroxysteroid 11-beta-dehydrogenase 1-like protein B [Alligator sinensis]|uniref:Hydroxysteroid 11-beta-dehydrogenase 1-like protein B n=1 Tax=Alligator sinensis TaxID=38654 RepID=A0A1U7SK68_ALLSI|nr:hydroxysteroid 11-beta-dehydrogenase 1-like protein B [Alligator sinensis]
MVQGKRVLVTGSSTGIGEQIAYEFARMGAHLIITARREKQLKEVAKKCLELGASSARYVVADMNNLSSAQEVIEEAGSKLGGLDYLVLNHVGGTGSFGPFQGDMTEVTSSMTVNFLSYVQLTASAMTMLKESQGSIIVISSLSGKESCSLPVDYLTCTTLSQAGSMPNHTREIIVSTLQEILFSFPACPRGFQFQGSSVNSLVTKEASLQLFSKLVFQMLFAN